MMRMLDRRDTQPPAVEFTQQLLDQRGLAAAGMADERNKVHDIRKFRS